MCRLLLSVIASFSQVVSSVLVVLSLTHQWAVLKLVVPGLGGTIPLIHHHYVLTEP